MHRCYIFHYQAAEFCRLVFQKLLSVLFISISFSVMLKVFMVNPTTLSRNDFQLSPLDKI